MEQRHQFSNRAGVTGQVNHWTVRVVVFDVTHQLLRQHLVVFQSDDSNSTTILHQPIAQRCVGFKWPRTYRQNTAAGVAKDQRFACNVGEVIGQTLFNISYQLRIKLYVWGCLCGQHDLQF